MLELNALDHGPGRFRNYWRNLKKIQCSGKRTRALCEPGKVGSLARRWEGALVDLLAAYHRRSFPHQSLNKKRFAEFSSRNLARARHDAGQIVAKTLYVSNFWNRASRRHAVCRRGWASLKSAGGAL